MCFSAVARDHGVFAAGLGISRELDANFAVASRWNDGILHECLREKAAVDQIDLKWLIGQLRSKLHQVELFGLSRSAIPLSARKTWSTRLASVHISHGASFVAKTSMVPMPCEDGHADGGLLAVINNPPLPLFEKPTKQELPQPAE